MSTNMKNFTLKEKERGKEALKGIYVSKDKIIASNGFILLEKAVSFDTNSENPFIFKVPKALKGIDSVRKIDEKTAEIKSGKDTYTTELIDEQYPDCSKIAPTEEPPYSVVVNAGFLETIAKEFKDGLGLVRICFYEGDMKPLVFKDGKDKKALLMPIYKPTSI